MNLYVTAGLCFAVVMVSMTGLYVVLSVLRSIAMRDSAPIGGELDARLVVLLTAAASEALQAPVRLHSVQLIQGTGAEAWSRAGRMDIMVSHRVEPKR
jgi:hypothetical protein